MKQTIKYIIYAAILIALLLWPFLMFKSIETKENDIQYIVDQSAYEDSKFVEITIQIVKNDADQEE